MPSQQQYSNNTNISPIYSTYSTYNPNINTNVNTNVNASLKSSPPSPPSPPSQSQHKHNQQIVSIHSKNN